MMAICIGTQRSNTELPSRHKAKRELRPGNTAFTVARTALSRFTIQRFSDLTLRQFCQWDRRLGSPGRVCLIVDMENSALSGLCHCNVRLIKLEHIFFPGPRCRD